MRGIRSVLEKPTDGVAQAGYHVSVIGLPIIPHQLGLLVLGDIRLRLNGLVTTSKTATFKYKPANLVLGGNDRRGTGGCRSFSPQGDGSKKPWRCHHGRAVHALPIHIAPQENLNHWIRTADKRVVPKHLHTAESSVLGGARDMRMEIECQVSELTNQQSATVRSQGARHKGLQLLPPPSGQHGFHGPDAIPGCSFRTHTYSFLIFFCFVLLTLDLWQAALMLEELPDLEKATHPLVGRSVRHRVRSTPILLSGQKTLDELDAAGGQALTRQDEPLAVPKPLLLFSGLRWSRAAKRMHRLPDVGARLDHARHLGSRRHHLHPACTLLPELAFLRRRATSIRHDMMLVKEIEAADADGVTGSTSSPRFEARVHASVDMAANEAAACVSGEASSPHAPFHKRVFGHANDASAVWQCDVRRLAAVLWQQRQV